MDLFDATDNGNSSDEVVPAAVGEDDDAHKNATPAAVLGKSRAIVSSPANHLRRSLSPDHNLRRSQEFNPSQKKEPRYVGVKPTFTAAIAFADIVPGPGTYDHSLLLTTNPSAPTPKIGTYGQHAEITDSSCYLNLSTTTPGPGRYTHDSVFASIASGKTIFSGNMSKSDESRPDPEFLTELTERSPGPMQYDPVKRSCTAPSVSFTHSTRSVSSSIHTVSPGPCWYDPDITRLASKPRAAAPVMAAAEGHGQYFDRLLRQNQNPGAGTYNHRPNVSRNGISPKIGFMLGKQARMGNVKKSAGGELPYYDPELPRGFRVGNFARAQTVLSPAYASVHASAAARHTTSSKVRGCSAPAAFVRVAGPAATGITFTKATRPRVVTCAAATPGPGSYSKASAQNVIFKPTATRVPSAGFGTASRMCALR